MKTLVITILIVVCLVSFGLAAVHFYLLDGLDGWFYSLAYEEDTLFSEGYSDSAFRRVYRGMQEAELRALLHTPLGEVWIYSNGSTRMGSVGFSESTVDYSNISERLPLGSIKVGMKKGDVIRILGEPQRKSFVYSRSRHDQSYRVRTVLLARGVVLGKRAYFYVD
jgi:outer membrane protein assembly factor BamE (lipoprotein component of BamABCDE complex)